MTTRISVLTPPPEGAGDVLSAEALAFLEMLHTRFEPVRRWYGEDHLVDESILHAIARGRRFALEGRDRRVHVRILHVFDIAEGRIQRESAWLDLAALQQQLAR